MIQRRYPVIFIAPGLTLLFVFSIVSILSAGVISLTNMNIKGLLDIRNIEFIGFANYQKVIFSEDFRQSLFNTIYYTVVGVPLLVFFSLATALMISKCSRFLNTLFRGIHYLPAVTNVIAVSFVWKLLYNPSYGIMNYMLSWFGSDNILWLSDQSVVKLSLIIMAVWRGMGINIIIYLAALSNVPKMYYEAATIDGASWWQSFLHITVPQLSYATFFVSTTALIGWLQFFDEVFIMTQGGPLNSSNSIAHFIYQEGIKSNQYGYSSAASFVLFVLIMAVTLLQFWTRRKLAS